MAEFTLPTARMQLREWRDDDFAALHALCTDSRVMATIGPLHDEARTTALLGRLQQRQANDGSTFWAMELAGSHRVVGFCGIAMGTVPQIADKLEIGWRLAADCWGQSLAREAAEASLAWARRERAGQTIWAITSVGNTRSRGLMERLGMTRRVDLDFNHPAVPPDSPLLPHVTYQLEP